MPPRRSHKKSRAGCKRCKARKIKCDEVHPRCSNCLKHGVPCDFEHPGVIHELEGPALSSNGLPSSASPTTFAPSALDGSARRPSFVTPTSSQFPSTIGVPMYQQPGMLLPSSQPVGRLTELRLMHQYTRHTHKTLAVTAPELEGLWGSSVPSLAFGGNQHLMDALLAVSALHLRSAWPHDKELVRASHAYMASCLNAYSSSLTAGIDASNAENLFLTATLIAFQSTATRIFTKDEGPFATGTTGPFSGSDSNGAGGAYQPPLAWFHSFQGVKTVVAASWPWLKQSKIILSIIDAQPVLNLNFSRAADGFFGHLLTGLDEELTALEPLASVADLSDNGTPGSSGGGSGTGTTSIVETTRQAYQHAVATLNWAHSKPGKGALAFPATVSKRFVELVEERQPRALAILASFFALLKTLDHVWWLQGMARREVLGIVSLFNSDHFGPDLERKWWPHLEWAVRVALYDPGQSGQNTIPTDIWGSSWGFEGGDQQGDIKFTSHIEMLSELVHPASPLPPPPSDNT
ncbi:hypothetical protein M406DRAFT_287346 [Cryphonectria parasitica EP155]|uniref:Zn(2)-C6 fungal-type domain-containing protein n=1 Tax=Cryphonectria parasitica (strain ATCC 38755 / EP155) TaxID=660469 RepID=A0A9P5CTK4_CRYP1|nr:uncharacterized protein M406DRAFT_287346 [Cryphonectria parasitica EP155]KAF3769235.1 hypothetical protein M406DRAFT_287346 [Cryphonectria parasitica EP155]